MKLSSQWIFLFIIALCFVPLANAQVIEDLPLDQDIMLNFTSNQQVTVYNLTISDPTTLSIDVRYLGIFFPFNLEVFDNSGSVVGIIALEEAQTYTFDLLPAGDYTLLFTVIDDFTGRAIINTNLHSQPMDGEWSVSYASVENSCPDVLTLDAVWLPADESTVTLTFNDPIEALDYHMAVAPDEIMETSEFFEIGILETGEYQVIPGIQGSPYTYTYKMIDAETIQLDYLETLSLSDCELSISVDLTFVGESIDSENMETDASQSSVDLSEWLVLGDADDLILFDDNSLCATDSQQGETWYFDAPQSFVDEIVNGYGNMLLFELKQDSNGSQFDDIDIVLVVGNGILLSYDLVDNPDTDFTSYAVMLTEGAGWVDVDGMFDLTDADLFQQILSDVTRLQIRGEFSTIRDTGCLRNPMVSNINTTAGNSSASTTNDSSSANATQSEETQSINEGQILVNGQVLQVGDWLSTGTLGGFGCEGQETWHSSAALDARTLNLMIQAGGIIDSSMTNPLLYVPTDIENQFLHDNTDATTVAFRFYLDFTSSTTGTYRQYFVTGSRCSGAFAFDLEFQG